MSDYGLLIEKLRTIATDPENKKKISSERIRKKFEKAYPGLAEKIMHGTDLNLVDRILELKKIIKMSETSQYQLPAEIQNIPDIQKTYIKKFGSNSLDYIREDKITFFFGCTKMPILYDNVLEIYEEHLELDTEGFYDKKHPFKNWNSFCRLCIVEYDRIKFMERRIWDIYDMHLKYYKNAYFKFKGKEIGDRETSFPRNFPRIHLLEQKSREFYSIHKKLLNNVSFKSKKLGASSAKPRGSIDWKKTIQLQAQGQNARFVSRQNLRNFVTPENKLFIISAHWIIRKADQLLENPNIIYQDREVLSVIKFKMQKIINDFPFSEVPRYVKKENLGNEYDEKIDKLVRETNERISNGKIQNGAYKQLLRWIDEVRNNVGLRTTIGKTQNDSIVLLSLRDIDTLYEIWILFEMIHQIFIKRNPYFVRDADGLITEIRIDWNGKNVEMFYDKLITEEETLSGIAAKPDYLFKSNGKTIAVFDAKNYSNNPEYKGANAKSEMQEKVSGYMMTLQCLLGLVILPHTEWGRESKKFPIWGGKEAEFGLHLLVPNEEHNEDDNKNPQKIREIISMLDRVISNPE